MLHRLALQHPAYCRHVPLSTCASYAAFLIQSICDGGIVIAFGVQLEDASNCCILTIASAERLATLTAARCIPYTLPRNP
jgi:hypothetical protein